ncbi:sigma-70 family RNA polymerase sigma factor [Bacillus testis]|uniref:sigma-70 family RNA polymerase sigma factor n=1 Tax=Bacillus testis TaxID=1622072 RepID=UPI00067F4FD4|nr:sigma-70 family RNA polymerase sigma factor [Bacillus testis]
MKLTEEQCQMIEDNIKLAYKFAHKFKARYPSVELETLKDLCVDGLIDAVQKVDEERGKLSTCVHWYCRGKIAHYFKALNTGKRKADEVSIESIVPDSDKTYLEIFYGYNDEYSFMDKDEIDFYTSLLTDEEKDVIDRYYYQEQSQKTIGKAINKYQPRVSALIRTAVQKMNIKYKAIEGC